MMKVQQDRNKMAHTSTHYGAISIHQENNVNDDSSSPEGCTRKAVKFGSGVLLFLLAIVGVTLFTSPFSFKTGKTLSSKASSKILLGSSSNVHDENEPLFYNEQLVNHFGDDDDKYWSQRFYLSTKYWGGAGYPILLIVGGEGSLDHGMLYPFVTEHLAKRFRAAVIQAEHRFYGPYKPVKHASTKTLLKLLTPQQAMSDMLRLYTHHLRPTEFQDCSSDRTSLDYCPFITIGASYPGFLSAMFRLVRPDIVDAAYASSAPLFMYAQKGDPNVYYDIVTAASQAASPGCPHSVKLTLSESVARLKNLNFTLDKAAAMIGICPDTIPKSMQSRSTLGDEIITLASYAFADYDMTFYPPGPDQDLYKVCKVFQDPDLDSFDTMSAFFQHSIMAEVEDDLGCDMKWVTCTEEEKLAAYYTKTGGRDCYDISEEDDDDPKEDSNNDDDGTMWNFQTCTTIIFVIGFSESSMFPVVKDNSYKTSLRQLEKECQEEFGVTPRPHELVDEWGFDDLVGQGASRILFTNGLRDMWAGGGVLQDLSESLLAITFENGAHHSDLTHEGPSDADTDDIREGFVKITSILEGWIAEIKSESSGP